MKKIAIFSHKVDAQSVSCFDTIIKIAQSQGFGIYFEENTLLNYHAITKHNATLQSFNHHHNLPQDTELFFAFGGDGTMLRAQTFIQEFDIPLVGINMGRLGFLAYFNIDELDETCINRLLQKEYTIEERSLLTVKYLGELETPENHFALNELAVTRKETTSMIVVKTYLNGELLNSYWADGLIIATPTGSTGYSLSCGGPIIDPKNHNFVITPIAPHNLFVRPFIISDQDVIRLTIDSRSDDYLLTLDSRISSLSKSIELEVKKATFNAKIVTLNKNAYINALRAKLFWGLDQRN